MKALQTFTHYLENLEAEKEGLTSLMDQFATDETLGKLTAYGYLNIENIRSFVHDGIIGPKDRMTPVWVHTSTPQYEVRIVIPLEDKPDLRETLIDGGFTKKQVTTSPSLHLYYENFFRTENNGHIIRVVFWKGVKEGDEIHGCKVVKRTSERVGLILACEERKE